MKRKKLPKAVKDQVWFRQKGRCACCIERGKEYHHFVAVSLGGNDSCSNIVFLCKKHHKLVHLDDLDTILTILEYIYYLRNGFLPDTNELLESANEIASSYINKEESPT